MMGLDAAQLGDWRRDGFVRLPGFAEASLLEAMLVRVVALARADAAGRSIGDAYVLPEAALARPEAAPEEQLSKLFRVQDAFYFPFDRGPQVGVWLAVTEAREDNGPLWVLPGSHREPVHRVVPDRREHAPFGYFEIVDHDTSAALPVLMQAGDLLVFHSHLMHRSTDNGSQQMRAAMVYHYACAGTVDRSLDEWGFTPPNVDWMPVRRRA